MICFIQNCFELTKISKPLEKLYLIKLNKQTTLICSVLSFMEYKLAAASFCAAFIWDTTAKHNKKQILKIALITPEFTTFSTKLRQKQPTHLTSIDRPNQPKVSSL